MNTWLDNEFATLTHSSGMKLQYEKYEEEYMKNRADVAKERGGIAGDDHQDDEGPCVRYGFVVSQVMINVSNVFGMYYSRLLSLFRLWVQTEKML